MLKRHTLVLALRFQAYSSMLNLGISKHGSSIQVATWLVVPVGIT